MAVMNQNKLIKKIESHLTKASTHYQSNQLKSASAECRAVFKFSPNQPDALQLSALIEWKKKNFKQAIKYFKRAITYKPNHPQFYYNMGVCCQEADFKDEAKAAYLKCLQLNPGHLAAIENLAVFYLDIGNYHESIVCLNQALQIAPNKVSNLKYMSNAYLELGEMEQALDYAHKAIAYLPVELTHNDSFSMDAHKYLGLLLLTLGEYKDGWIEHNYGINQDVRPHRDYGYPEWKGERLEDRDLLIIGEQGIGDEIMFASCFPNMFNNLKPRHCIIECEPRLQPLFDRAYPQAIILARGDDAAVKEMIPKDAYQILSGKLPQFFRNHRDDFPKQANFLFANPQKTQLWKQRLAQLPGRLKIGLSWKGGHNPRTVEKRSIELSRWKAILIQDGIDFINVQYGDSQEELKLIKHELGVHIHDWDEIDPLKNMDEFAAMISALDLVISIDNSTVHLTGALGVKTWVLLPKIPDWRWMLEGSDTPWYPSLTLYRQTIPNEWEDVFKKLSHDLSEYSKGMGYTPKP